MTPATTYVPPGIDGVTPQWLTEVVGGRVTDVRVEQIAQDSGFSSLLYRAHLTGDSVPDSVIVKLPAQSEAGQAMVMLGGYAREVAFYREVAGRAPMGTPHVYMAGMAERRLTSSSCWRTCSTGTTPIILPDCRWIALDAPSRAGRSARVVDRSGAGRWTRGVSEHRLADGARPASGRVRARLAVPIEKGRLTPFLRRSPGIAERFAELAPRAIEALAERAMLLHGDIRADNMFFSGDQLKVVDFQFASRGGGATDIGYLVSQGLPTEVRRGRDEVLVREYLERLASHGVDDYSFDEAWRHYRFAVAYLMVLPVDHANRLGRPAGTVATALLDG